VNAREPGTAGSSMRYDKNTARRYYHAVKVSGIRARQRGAVRRQKETGI
jgi:hypothetical protein